jgi:hypothetical protein
VQEKQAEQQAEAEAAVFIRLVRLGRMTVEECEEVIGVPPETRALLVRFAEEHGGYSARMVRQALAFRERVLAEFKRRCTPIVGKGDA